MLISSLTTHIRSSPWKNPKLSRFLLMSMIDCLRTRTQKQIFLSFTLLQSDKTTRPCIIFFLWVTARHYCRFDEPSWHVLCVTCQEMNRRDKSGEVLPFDVPSNSAHSANDPDFILATSDRFRVSSALFDVSLLNDCLILNVDTVPSLNSSSHNATIFFFFSVWFLFLLFCFKYGFSFVFFVEFSAFSCSHSNLPPLLCRFIDGWW